MRRAIPSRTRWRRTTCRWSPTSTSGSSAAGQACAARIRSFSDSRSSSRRAFSEAICLRIFSTSSASWPARACSSRCFRKISRSAILPWKTRSTSASRGALLGRQGLRGCRGPTWTGAPSRVRRSFSWWSAQDRPIRRRMARKWLFILGEPAEIGRAREMSPDDQSELFPEPGPAPEGARRRRAARPLAVRMRPRRLSEVVGQDHILGPGSLLARPRGPEQLRIAAVLRPAGAAARRASPRRSPARRAAALCGSTPSCRTWPSSATSSGPRGGRPVRARSSSSTSSTGSTRRSRTCFCPTSSRASSGSSGRRRTTRGST